jgi:hypothetical protein
MGSKPAGSGTVTVGSGVGEVTAVVVGDTSSITPGPSAVRYTTRVASVAVRLGVLVGVTVAVRVAVGVAEFVIISGGVSLASTATVGSGCAN